jgi:hypothetical protein
LQKQQFLEYGDVNFSQKYTLRVQWDRLKLLIKTVKYSPGNWCKTFIDLVYQNEAIFSKKGLESLNALTSLPADVPLELKENSITVLHLSSLVQCLTWEKCGGAGLTTLGIWTQWIDHQIPSDFMTKKGVSVLWDSVDKPTRVLSRQDYQFHQSVHKCLIEEDIKEVFLQLSTLHVTFVHKKHGQNRFQLALPIEYLNYFDIQEGNIAGIAKDYTKASWFFVPTTRNTDQTSLSLLKTLQYNNQVRPHVVIVVVQPRVYVCSFCPPMVGLPTLSPPTILYPGLYQ